MRRSRLVPFVGALLLGVVVLISTGCSERDGFIKRKLDVILMDDLAAIVEDVADSNRCDSIHYVITLYKDYNEGRYSRMAEAEFFFLEGVRAKIVRKYRYDRDYKKWDRFFNEYRFY